MTGIDGNVAGIWGDAIITTPNQSFVPEVPLRCSVSVHLRRDFRFGPDDPTLWPQAYLKKFPHLGCICRKPFDKLDELGMMWWDPLDDDFKQCHDVTIGGVGRWVCKEMSMLRSLKNRLRDEANTFLEESSNKSLLVQSSLMVMNH